MILQEAGTECAFTMKVWQSTEAMESSDLSVLTGLAGELSVQYLNQDMCRQTEATELTVSTVRVAAAAAAVVAELMHVTVTVLQAVAAAEAVAAEQQGQKGPAEEEVSHYGFISAQT